MSAWSEFLTVHAVLVDAIEKRLTAAGLPPLAWYDALWALERADAARLRLSEFERHMVISRSNITRLVDRLQAAGCVERERADEDGRGAYAVLTPEGRKLRKRMWAVYGAAVAELFEQPLGETQQRQLEAAMAKLLAARRAPRTPTGPG